MTTELIIAPPAAGKTFTCIQRIQTIRKDHPLAKIWVIVPDRLQAAAFRKRLASAGGALGTQVGRFNDLYLSILEQTGTYIPSATSTLLYRLIQETVDDTIAKGELPYYAPLQTFPGFTQSLRGSFAELKQALIYPEKFSQFALDGTPAQKDLAVLYDRFQTRLRDLNWTDQEDINWLAVNVLERQSSVAAAIQLLIVDGFDSFNGAQYRVLKLLSEQVGKLLITFPGERNSKRPAHHRFTKSIQRLICDLSPKITTLDHPTYLPSIVGHLERHLFNAEPVAIHSTDTPILLEARSPADETREALRWIKKLVVRENVLLSNCVIFTPNPSLYHPLLRANADEFGIPIRFTLDESLENSPAIASLINLLSLPVNNFNSHYLINALRSPYFEYSIDAEMVDTFEMISRVAQIVEGQDQWEETWERLASPTNQERLDLDDERNSPKLPRGSDVAEYRKKMKAVFNTITPPGQICTQTEWIIWLEDLLEQLRFYERADSERDQSACEVFRETLQALVMSEAVTEERKVSFSQFLADLQATLVGEAFREQDLVDQPVLLVGRMTEARGTRFQAVVLLGLSEGSFPKNVRPDPFLSEDMRHKLGMESRLQQEQPGLFYQAVTRTDKYLLITRPYLSEDGEEWEESAFWKAVASLLDVPAVIRVNPDTPLPLTEAASTQELLFLAVRRKSLSKKFGFLENHWRDLQQAQAVLQARRSKQIKGPYEGFIEPVISALSQRYSESEIWSASRLESYSNCPFRFFVGNALELEPRIPPKLGLDVRQLGSILHKILELTYKNAADPTDLQIVLDSLQKTCTEVFLTAPQIYGFRPSSLWEIEKTQLIEKLENTIHALAEDRTWTPFAYEQGFGFNGSQPLKIRLGNETVRVHGVIDRVDRNSNDQLRVIDYKTGSSHLATNDFINGYRLQLPIYAMAAQDALALGIPVEGIYWNIQTAEAGSLKLSKFSTDNAEGVEATVDVLCAHLIRILHGIRSAAFSPRTPKGGCPSYCPAAQWCWHFESGW